MRSLGRTLLAFALFHFVLQGQTCLLLLTSYFCILVLRDEKDVFFSFFFLLLALESLVGLHSTVHLLWH